MGVVALANSVKLYEAGKGILVRGNVLKEDEKPEVDSLVQLLNNYNCPEAKCPEASLQPRPGDDPRLGESVGLLYSAGKGVLVRHGIYKEEDMPTVPDLVEKLNAYQSPDCSSQTYDVQGMGLMTPKQMS